MLFQTLDFIIFFAVVVAGMALLRPGLRTVWLLAASYYFYAALSPAFLVFIIYISLVDYAVGRGLGATSSVGVRKLLVTLSVLNGVALLSLFKYADFITENLQSLLAACDLDWHVPTVAESATAVCAAFGIDYAMPAKFLLPVGLSYFTFKSLSYTIDLYRGALRVERSLLRYACYLAFFPSLLSGPIDRATLFLKQLRHRMPVRRTDISDGLSMFIGGLFKKVVLADTLALFVNQVYNAPSGSYDAPTVLFATYAFAWQLYGDFSGYSDMARGVARLMGFHITFNFNNPYVAVDFSDFWRRWHISLSTWFRDYVYIPLGGSRVAKWRVLCNLFITMVVSGFWHGAAWTFVAWGAWHGVLCVLWRGFDKSGWYSRIPSPVKQLVVFNLAAFGWVFFRANSWSSACDLVKTLLTWSDAGDFFVPWAMFLPVAAVWGYQLIFASPRWGRVLNSAPARYLALAAAILLILVVPADANPKFLYFDF